jgi:hypothetical protein
MQRLLRIVGRWMLLLAGLLVAAYVFEDLLLRYRASHGGTSAVFDKVTTYEAGALKGGKQEFYFDQPQVVECVRALFPHFGDPPCWYARRHTIQLLSRNRRHPRLSLDPEDVYGARNSKFEVIWICG